MKAKRKNALNSLDVQIDRVYDLEHTRKTCHIYILRPAS